MAVSWKSLRSVFIANLACLAFFSSGEACTRVVYQGSDDVVLTGRSMDWAEDMRSNLWVFPKGIKRNGAVNQNSPEWKSKYGSLIVSGYDIGTADGMNEKGLVANALYLAESDYGSSDKSKPLLSISLWAQYVLDNFATVDEAVDQLRKEPFKVVAPVLPNGAPAQLHLSISDASGDSAIFEYLSGKLVIHHGKQFSVMTNSPSYDEQLALDSYWKTIGGTAFLPGTNRAADRFVRASFFLNTVPKEIDPHYSAAVLEKNFTYQALASVLGIMRSVSIPLGISTPHQPNIASTLWRTVSDQKNKVYYFDSATRPNTFWVPLAELNFEESAPVMKLTLTEDKVYAGDAVKNFQPAKPFNFLPAKI